MPPIQIIAPTIVRFTFRHTVAGGRPAQVTCDVSCDEFVITRHDAVNTLAPKVQDQWQGTMVGGFSNSVQYLGCHFTDLDSLGGISGDLGFNASLIHAGTTSGAVSPANVTFLVKKSCSATRGTRNGRMYLPGVRESDTNDDGTLVSGIISTLNTGLAAFKSGLASIGTVPVPMTTSWRVVHVVGHGPPEPGWPIGKPNAWNSTDVTSATVDSKVATQRRRLRG